MFKLKPISYSFDALEPHYDAKTVEIHHTKHHQSYVDNLNNALSKFPEFLNWSLEDILKNLDKVPNEIRTAVKNNAGGIYNHDFFWEQFSSNPKEVNGKILDLINSSFGSFEQFKTEFETKAKTNFGSGWTWLVLNPNGKLEIINTSGHDCPISMNLKPLMTIDIWEHAYYLKFQNRRPEWISEFWNILDWDFVNKKLV